MVKQKKRAKKLNSPCELCGREIECVWMKEGTVKAVEADRRVVIFSNYANCDGREMFVWIPHHENCEKNR